MMKKILVATDGSDHANKAVELAADIALQNNAVMYLLHAVAKVDIPESFKRFAEVERMEMPPERAFLHKVGADIVSASEKRAKDKGVEHIKTSLILGDPAESILDFAREKDVDMIILGSRGLGSMKGLFLGSVSSKVCHLADRTCMTLK